MAQASESVSRRSELPNGFYEWLLLTPAILLIGGLTIFPVLYNIHLSFYQKHAYLTQKHFVGVGNYISIFRDAEFHRSFWNGFIYASGSIILQLVIGTAAAMLVNCRFRGRNFVRGVLLFPYLVPTIVVAILWKWLLNASYGLINYALVAMGVVSTQIVWLSRDLAMTTLILVSTWQFFPFVLVSVLARLQTIPEELYRAARIDNSPWWATFTHVTFPAIRNVLMTVVLLRSIWMFTKFDTVWLLVGREAVGKYIETVPVYTYRITFEYLQAGMGSAVSVVLFMFLVASSLAYVRATTATGADE